MNEASDIYTLDEGKRKGVGVSQLYTVLEVKYQN